MKKTIKIKNDILNLIEKTDYEATSSSNIIISLIENPSIKNVVNSEIFKRYEDKFIKKYTSYEFLKMEVGKYIMEELKTTDSIFNWELDYSLGEVTVDIIDDKKSYKEFVSIDIKPDELKILQLLYYSVEAKKYIITKLFERNKLNNNVDVILESDSFISYQNQLIKLEQDLEKEKKRLEKEFMPLKFLGQDVFYNFNFFDNQLEVYVL